MDSLTPVIALLLLLMTAPVRADVMPCGRCSYDRRAARNDMAAGLVALGFAGVAAYRLSRRRPRQQRDTYLD